MKKGETSLNPKVLNIDMVGTTLFYKDDIVGNVIHQNGSVITYEVDKDIIEKLIKPSCRFYQLSIGWELKQEKMKNDDN